MILRERLGARPVPRRGLLGLYHFAILLPDRAALGRFVQHVGTLGVYAGSADHAVSESLYLTDPDGLGIEVYADRPRTTWQVNGSEVHITVEPLDLRDLVREAGGTPWTGLPAGTVIGHMHLYVGELEEASASIMRRSASTKRRGAFRGRCSSPRAAITTISAPTSGPRGRPSQPTRTPGCSSGTWSFLLPMSRRRRRA